MLHKQFDEFYGWDSFLHVDIIFVPVVMECDGVMIFIISVYPFRCDYGTPQIPANVFRYGLWISKGGFCINIETFVMDLIHICFDLKRLRAAYDMTTMLVVTEPCGNKITFIGPGTVKKGQSLMVQ